MTPSGWVVRDGGFQAVVIDPDGIEAGGDFPGFHMPPGTTLFWGDYNILMTGQAGEIHIRYRSNVPLVLDELGQAVISCQLSINDFANGEKDGDAQGVSIPPPPSDESLFFNVRNVLTFDR